MAEDKEEDEAKISPDVSWENCASWKKKTGV